MPPATIDPNSVADQFPPIERVQILQAQLPASNPPVLLVRGASIRLAPGQATGIHFHPASVVGVITEGAFNFQPEGEEVRVLQVGDCFFEPANHIILRFDNASDSKWSTFIAFYLTDGPSRSLIEPLNLAKV